MGTWRLPKWRGWHTWNMTKWQVVSLMLMLYVVVASADASPVDDDRINLASTSSATDSAVTAADPSQPLGAPACSPSMSYTASTTNAALCGRSAGGTTLTYTGTTCGNGAQILWESMSANNVRPDLTQSQCQWSSAGKAAGWKAIYTGSCGVAPSAIPDLPVSCTGITPLAGAASKASMYTLSIGTAGPGKLCEFPFYFDDKWHHSCMGAGEKPPFPLSVNFLGQKLNHGWCSTTTNMTKDGQWGACGGCAPGYLDYPTCQQTCHESCHTCSSPDGAYAKANGCVPEHSWSWKADPAKRLSHCAHRPGEQPNARKFGGSEYMCTSCRPGELWRIIATQYEGYKFHKSADTWQSVMAEDTFNCKKFRGKRKLELSSRSNWLRYQPNFKKYLKANPSQPDFWGLFVKVSNNPRYHLIKTRYETRKSASPHYKTAFVLHHGEEWRSKCNVEKRVRCQYNRDLELSGKCLVTKQASCQSVQTQRVGLSAAKVLAKTFGKWKLNGKLMQLPAIDTSCVARPPLIKTIDEWCTNAIVLL